ncbi:MAG: hypothetical protein KAU52_05950 [Methanosarcinales archaeon]|nr:hypothetical protein [Methanosarcinales archaeon]
MMPVIEVSDATLRQLDQIRVRMHDAGASYDDVIRHLLGMGHIRPVYIKSPEPEDFDDGIGIYRVD